MCRFQVDLFEKESEVSSLVAKQRRLDKRLCAAEESVTNLRYDGSIVRIPNTIMKPAVWILSHKAEMVQLLVFTLETPLLLNQRYTSYRYLQCLCLAVACIRSVYQVRNQLLLSDFAFTLFLPSVHFGCSFRNSRTYFLCHAFSGFRSP